MMTKYDHYNFWNLHICQNLTINIFGLNHDTLLRHSIRRGHVLLFLLHLILDYQISMK